MDDNLLYKSALKLANQNIVSLSPEREGDYDSTDGELISILQCILTKKYEIDVAYRSFADRVKGPWRDALVEHWQEHAKEERAASYDIAMKIVGLGADPMIQAVTLPPCPGNLAAFCACLMEMELDLIAMSRDLIECCGENVSMRVLAENIILVDTQHLDDLRRMCDRSL